MRRADRLFRIVQVLRRRRLTTAAQLAERLEVSERTVYRDVRDLIVNGVPIEGEAGVGYRLGTGFEMPPLMFNRDEVDALMLGMRMVEQWGDGDLRSSARSIIDKVDSVLPQSERERLASTALFALSFRVTDHERKVQRTCRRAIDERRLLSFDYRDRSGALTRRAVRPLGLFFWGQAWTLAAYCDLREGFRNFRLDRMTRLRLRRDHFELAPPITLDDYMRAMRET